MITLSKWRFKQLSHVGLLKFEAIEFIIPITKTWKPMFPFEKKKEGKKKERELTELRRFFHISAEKPQKINHTRKSYEKGK